MLTIQNLLRNVYCCIKNISKKLYRSCAILVSGFSVFALILLNDQNFHGAGKIILQSEAKLRAVQRERLDRKIQSSLCCHQRAVW